MELHHTWSPQWAGGWEGALAINYRKLTRSAGKTPRNDTSDTRQDECLSVTQQHDLPQDSLQTGTFKYAFQNVAHPPSSAFSPRRRLNHILRMWTLTLQDIF